jgi:hypothetical protein
MKKFLFVFLVLICVFFTACENFLEGASSREIIEDTVTIAKSENVDLTIKARSDKYGILEPEGDLTFKAAQKVRVNFKLNHLYVFSRWAVIDKATGQEVDDAVLLTDKLEEIDSSGNTILYATLIFKKNRKNLQLMPVCYIKTDKTAPEFTDFKVYNLGTYNSEDESQNVLVTDKPFDEWNTDEDYVNHHVNGLKLKFTVFEEDCDIRDCTLKVTESMIKKSNGESISLVSNDEQSINKSTEIISNDDFSYTVSFDYKFVSAYDGILKINLRLEDTAGNLSDAKTFYVVKDTVIRIFETYEEFNWETYEYEEKRSIVDDETFASHFSFYDLPSEILNESTSQWSDSVLTNKISNFLSDTQPGGYATPEGFQTLLNKYYLKAAKDSDDVWLNLENEYADPMTLQIAFSIDGINYDELEFAETSDGNYDSRKYLLRDRMKVFSEEEEPDNLYYEKDAWYFDVSQFKKSEVLYFRFTLTDKAGNKRFIYWDNNKYHSASPDRISRLYHRGPLNNDIIAEHSEDYPIYSWSASLSVETDDIGDYNIPSKGFFYYLTLSDGQKTTILYSLLNKTYLECSWSGNSTGAYISPNDSLTIQYGLQHYCTENGPEDYAFTDITMWNTSCLMETDYDEEQGESYYITYFNTSDAVSFSYNDISIKNYEDVISVTDQDNEDGTVNLCFYYDGLIQTAFYSSYGWQIFVKYNGRIYVSTDSPEYDVGGSSLTIPNVPVSIVREGITFEAWGKCSGIPVTFTNTSYCNPNSGKDITPPKFTRAPDSISKVPLSKYYPYDNYKPSAQIFNFHDRSFERGDTIDVTVYYTNYTKIEFTADYIKSCDFVNLKSEPVKTWEDDPLLYTDKDGYADVIFDYSFLEDRIYTVFFVLKDKYGNEGIYTWILDNTLFSIRLSLNNAENYTDEVSNLEGTSFPTGGGFYDNSIVYDSNHYETSFRYMYANSCNFRKGYPNGRYSNTVYFCPAVSYWMVHKKEGYEYEISKEEYDAREFEDDYDYFTKTEGYKSCSVKAIKRSDEDGVYYVFCDQNVLVEYLLSDIPLKNDVDYWEHHTSNRNKTFTEVKVANEGQTTIKAYKIPKVPAGKYGFIIFHFADGTSMNSGVIEG